MKNTRRVWVGVLLVFATAHGVVRQEETSSGADHYRRVLEARTLVSRGDYAQAASAFERLTRAAPYAAELWGEYARALEQSGRPLDAARAYQQMLVAGASFRAQIEYRVARDFAFAGMADSAFAWLERALRGRLESRPQIQSDTAFRALREDPRFAPLAGLRGAALSRDDAWRADLDFLVQESQRLHVGFDRPAFSAAFVDAAAQLRRDIPMLSDARIQLEMRALLVRLGDGHTNLFPQFTRLPIDFYRFSDGLFVIQGSGVGSDLVGSRVLAIGSLSAEDALRQVARFVSRDNETAVSYIGAAMLAQPIVLHAMDAIPDTARVPLTVRDARGAVRTMNLGSARTGPAMLVLRSPPAATTPAPLYLKDAATLWFEPLPDARALYLQYNAVAHPQGETTAQFAERLKAALRDSQSEHLIVDIRQNSGGNTFLYPPLLNAIIHFRESSPDHRVWVIIGRRTFSAAQNFASTLDRYITDAIFVGEPTGSRPNFVGESPPVVLPHSGQRASISSRYHQNADFTDERNWIAPDVPAALTSADYFANRDPALDAILSLIRTRSYR